MKNDGLRVAWNDQHTNYIKSFGAEFIAGDKNNILALFPSTSGWWTAIEKIGFTFPWMVNAMFVDKLATHGAS